MMGRMIRALIAVAFVVSFHTAPLAAQDVRPLVIDGKDTLFQRVLLRNRIQARSAPDGEILRSFAPLQALYVYTRQRDWLEVALGTEGEDRVWIPDASAVDWNQNIVATLEGGANVERLMFFSDENSVYDIIESENPAAAAAPFLEAALTAEQGGAASQDVIALGPQEAIDQRNNLYVMPILDAERAIFDVGGSVNVLKVAVARSDLGGRLQLDTESATTEAARQNFKAAVVFVVDTTISMEPYINATRDALEEVYAQIAQKNETGVVSFGLIGFRDNVDAAPGLEYDVQTFVNLQEGRDADAFLGGISRMTEANASSRNFREDSFAGIEFALTSLDWSDFGAKYIVLVTDASPRGADDELSATGLSPSALNSLVKERIKGVIAALHLRTPRGEADHARAENAYTEMTRQTNEAPLYFPVENGDAEIYRQTARELGRFISDQVISFRSGDAPEEAADSSLFAVQALASAGRTMQLAYLGSTTGTAAPDVFEAYVVDRDFDRRSLTPLSIRVLLNKSELSNLVQALEIIIQNMEESIIAPDEFFSGVLAAAAAMSRNPDTLNTRSDATLAEAVSISEYLDGLPYTSDVMGYTQEEWVRLTIPEQVNIQNDLYAKLQLYRSYNQSTDLWVDYLGAGPSSENLLYPMPVSSLP